MPIRRRPGDGPATRLPEATSLLDLDSRVSRTASDLNASVNRCRVVFGMQTSNFIILPHMDVSMK